MQDKRRIDPIEKFEGTVHLKGDKSISHRAVIIASIADGHTTVKNFLSSVDCLYTVKAFQQLGIPINISGDNLIIKGKGLNGLTKPSGEIYLGNSGTSMRLMSGVLAGQDFESTLTGDESLSQRPMERIIEPLKSMGADIRGRDKRYAPLVIKGSRLKPIKYKTKVASAQVKSAIILAGLYADGVTEVEEPMKSRDHTERMLSLFGAKLKIENLKIFIYGKPRLKPRTFTIPGDISTAAFFITGALLLDGSEVVIKDLLLNRTRMGFVDALLEMGGDISIENRHFNGYEDVCNIVVKSSPLKGITVDEERIPSLIDELPILMVAAAFAKNETHIKGAGELRVKETDRINSMTQGLKKMGAKVSVNGDDISIKGRDRLKGTRVDSLDDHRTAMALTIASLCADGESEIKGVDCVNTSSPEFFQILGSISRK